MSVVAILLVIKDHKQGVDRVGSDRDSVLSIFTENQEMVTFIQ